MMKRLLMVKFIKITNLVNGKIYIGQTIKTVEQRFKEHCVKNKRIVSAINKAIQKYGKENFIFEQIDSATTYSELNQKEYDLIRKENTISPNGYNLRDGGMMGTVSEETKLKHSESFRGRIMIYNSENNQHKFIHIQDDLPDGFIKGHNPNIFKNPERIAKISNAHKNKIIVQDKITEKLYKIIKENFDEKTMEIVFFSNKGMKAYYHPESKKTIMISHEQEIPEGFICGTAYEKSECSDETRQKLSKIHKGKIRKYKFNNTNVKDRKYYHHPETKQVIMLKSDQNIPEGFILGRGFSTPPDYKPSEELKRRNSEMMKNKIWIHNPSLKINRRINKEEEIPEGFIRGRFKDKE